jgi:hypothetical protein
MYKLWPCALLLAVAACSAPATPERDPAPAAAFGALEDRLMAAETVRIDYHVTSEGAFDSDIKGRLEITPGGAIELTGNGAFGGQPVELFVRTSNDGYEFGNGSKRKSAPLPPRLREALVIGLTRMGILHNLAVLTAAAPPDRADGGVREWVTVDSFARHGAAVTFDVSVAGQRAASANLEIDADGRPVIRRQTVTFPSGEMKVVERYSDVIIEP